MKHLIKICVAAMLLFSSLNSQAQCSVVVREAFGAATSVMLYNSYITVGSIADMNVKEVIKKDYAIQLASEQIEILNAVYEAFQKVTNDKSGSLSSDDMNVILLSMSALKNLKQMTVYLKQNIEDGKGAEQYSKYRNSAWSDISLIMGFEEE